MVTLPTLPPTPKPHLRDLIDAILRNDLPAVTQLLTAQPHLATASLATGATRADSATFFLQPIGHYLYAGDTALHLAAAAYRLAIAETLIQQGAHVRARNRRGAEPLHYAADGSPDAAHWNPAAQAAVIALLIRHGADPNSLDKSGVAPLHRAVRHRCPAAVQALLQHGADAGLPNKSGSTAWLLAHQPTGRTGSGSPTAKACQEEIKALLQAPSLL